MADLKIDWIDIDVLITDTKYLDHQISLRCQSIGK